MAEFSETLMDHFQSPRNMGRMESPDVIGTAGTPGHGRFVLLYLRMEDQCVRRAQFECNGCGVTIAVCSVLTELVEGRTRVDCAALQAADLSNALDGIPAHKADCASFAIVALRNALNQKDGAHASGASSPNRPPVDMAQPFERCATMTSG